MAKYSPGSELVGSPTLGWASAKMLEASAQKLSNPPTSQDVLNGLWSLNGNDLNGMTMPLQFAKDKTAPPQGCWWNQVVKDKQFQTPDSQRHCL